jgi:hypothetical protein
MRGWAIDLVGLWVLRAVEIWAQLVRPRRGTSDKSA